RRRVWKRAPSAPCRSQESKIVNYSNGTTRKSSKTAPNRAVQLQGIQNRDLIEPEQGQGIRKLEESARCGAKGIRSRRSARRARRKTGRGGVCGYPDRRCAGR